MNGPLSRQVWALHLLSGFCPPLALAVDLWVWQKQRADAPVSFRVAIWVDSLILVLLLALAALFMVRPTMSSATHPGLTPHARLGIESAAQRSPEGTPVSAVRANTSAARAGIQPGDRIVRVDATPTPSVEALLSALDQRPPSATREVEVLRADGQRSVLHIQPDTLHQPSPRTLAFRGGVDALCTGLALGLVLLLVWLARRASVPGALSLFLGGALVMSIIRALTELVAFIPIPLRSSVVLLAAELLMLPCALLLRRRLDPRAPALDRQLTTVTAYGQGLALTFGWNLRAALLLWTVGALFDVAPGMDESFLDTVRGGGGRLDDAAIALAMALVAPVVEELVFRGALLGWLGRFLAPWTAIAASTALFALLHAETHGSGVLQVALIGAVLGWMRVATGSLHAGILLHATINGMSFLALQRL